MERGRVYQAGYQSSDAGRTGDGKNHISAAPGLRVEGQIFTTARCRGNVAIHFANEGGEERLYLR